VSAPAAQGPKSAAKGAASQSEERTGLPGADLGNPGAYAGPTMSLFAITAATAIAAASAAAAVATLFTYAYFARRSEAHAARDEALALAATRAEVIIDLRRRAEALEQQLTEMSVDCERRIRDCEDALRRADADAREMAYQMHRVYAIALADLLREVQSALEREPPNLDRALARIRELLEGERPAA
jgi:hypothetical protein